MQAAEYPTHAGPFNPGAIPPSNRPHLRPLETQSVAPEDAAAIAVTDARLHGGGVPYTDPEMTDAVEAAAAKYFANPYHPEPKPQDLFHEVPDPAHRPVRVVRPKPIASAGYSEIPGEYVTRDDMTIWEFFDPPITKEKAGIIMSAEAKAHGGTIPKDGLGARAEAAAYLIEQGRLEEAEQKLPGSTRGLKREGEEQKQE
ncbi:hypothetical protein WJX72_002617 [[Myrmecia] bisecta]|uniref:Uncharacterized protein n=1 Tax=[Myrmecia] bisecta TaxID=41462 RepID=A0AAW1QEG1_9CHLO